MFEDRLSLLPWTSWLSVTSAFLPPVAALWRRRSLVHEPAGQVALGWLVMSLFGVATVLQFLRVLPRAIPFGGLVALSFPLLLLSPTLAWIGPAAKRKQWVALGVWAALAVVLIVTHPERRQLRLVAAPTAFTTMAILSVAALGARARSAVGELRRQDWFWILTAHVMYFASEMLRAPLMETLSGRLDLGAVLGRGFSLVHTSVYLMVAWGMLQPAPESPKTPNVPAVPGMVAP